MKIKSIEITNIKGIENRVFDLDLIPNKPNLLVAPNGFGKSSFGIAYDSLKRSKIELDKKHYHKDREINEINLFIKILIPPNSLVFLQIFLAFSHKTLFMLYNFNFDLYFYSILTQKLW